MEGEAVAANLSVRRAWKLEVAATQSDHSPLFSTVAAAIDLHGYLWSYDLVIARF
jgi:hypothetical protein